MKKAKKTARIPVLTGRNVKETLRDPLSLIFTVFMPLLMEVLFYLLFHGLTEQFEMKYFAPGIVVFSQAFLALFTGLLLALDRSTSFLTRLYVSGTRSHEFILGYGLSVLPIAFAQTVLFFAVGCLFDPSLFGVRLLLAVPVSLVTSFFFIGCGLLVGSLANEKSVGGLATVVIVGQSVLSGMWFPLEGINAGMLTAMKVLPFRNATLLLQNVTNGYADFSEDILFPLLIVLAYTLAVFLAAVAVFRRKMKA